MVRAGLLCVGASSTGSRSSWTSDLTCLVCTPVIPHRPSSGLSIPLSGLCPGTGLGQGMCEHLWVSAPPLEVSLQSVVWLESSNFSQPLVPRWAPHSSLFLFFVPRLHYWAGGPQPFFLLGHLPLAWSSAPSWACPPLSVCLTLFMNRCLD